MTNLNQQRNGDENAENKHAAEPPEMQSPPTSSIYQEDGHYSHADHDSTNAYKNEINYIHNL